MNEYKSPIASPRALVVGASETAALLHLPVLTRLRDAGRIVLVEICDLRLRSAADAWDQFGFARYSSDAAKAIAQPDIDLVYLFGGAALHYELGRSALDNGKHLFVEKPVSPGYAEARSLAAAAQARGLIAVGGHNRRFHPGLSRIGASAGQIGWTYAEAAFHKPEFGRPPPFGARSWLSGNGIHALDALVFMMGGLPEHLIAQAGGTGADPSVFSAVMRWPNGAQGAFLSNNEAGERREEYSFHAPGESWRLIEDRLTLDRDGTALDLGSQRANDSFAAEHDAFLKAVATGGSPPHAIAALAPSLFLAELIEAGHNGPVRLPARIVPCRTERKAGTIMLAGAERLRPYLGSMPAGHRLVSIDELERSREPRPDIVAAVLGQGAQPFTDELLDRLPNLAIVGVVGLSLRRLAADRLTARDILVVNASAAYADSVAEFALGLAILGRRRAFASSQAIRRGGWGSRPVPPGLGGLALGSARWLRPLLAKARLESMLLGFWRSNDSLSALSAVGRGVPKRDLRGALVGLIGWGANARAFAYRLAGAGARVLVHTDHSDPADIRAVGAEPATLAAVLTAEIVSLHRGLTSETRYCIGKPELDRLRPGTVLINVARGALIEPDALVVRLRRGDITACLDTFEEEPLPRRHPLRRMRNVFLTSHIAGGSPDMHAAAAREAIGKVAAWLDGQSVETVTAERLATMT